MIRSILAFGTTVALVVGTVALATAAEPNGATGHGADVSAVAKAVHNTQGNAHGKAVSAIASAHGKEVSAAARARAAANKAAGQAKGAAGRANGQANKANGQAGAAHGNGNGKGAGGASGAPTDEAPVEPGRVKDGTSGG